MKDKGDKPMPLEKCYSCPYACWISQLPETEPKLECDPPMGECLAEQPEPDQLTD